MEEKLKESLVGKQLGGSVRITVEDECSVAVSSDGNLIDDKDFTCDCTVSSDKETFKSLADGSESPMGAYFSGKLKITGDLNIAMGLASVLGG